MLRPRALEVPEGEGWGVIHVVEADDGYDEPAEPKTGKRTVPAPPVLVQFLRTWTDEQRSRPDDLLFRTDVAGGLHNQTGVARSSGQPTLSQPRLSPYDCRHACATTWLAGGAVGEWKAARSQCRDLVAHYVGALAGDDNLANRRIEAALGHD